MAKIDKTKASNAVNAVMIKKLATVVQNMNKLLIQRDQEFIAHLVSIVDFLTEVHPDLLLDKDGKSVDLYARWVNKVQTNQIPPTIKIDTGESPTVEVKE